MNHSSYCIYPSNSGYTLNMSQAAKVLYDK